MFKIYDLNYNEIPLPVDDLGYGLKGLDINIGPITYENIYGESNRTDNLIKRFPKDRTVTLEALFTSYDTSDWRLKRDGVYNFFRSLGPFYVAESHQPFKLLKVIVDSDYTPEREILTWGMLEIELKVLDSPFKKSLHTTQEIDDEGINWNDKWAYGMGLSADSAQWQYSFSGEDPQFYNAGTEEIKLIKQKESEITLKINAIPPNDLIDIDDGETVFKIWHNFSIGDTLRISGHNVTLNGNNILAETNFNFLTVKTGWNNWNIRGVPHHNYEFEIDFRFLYD